MKASTLGPLYIYLKLVHLIGLFCLLLTFLKFFPYFVYVKKCETSNAATKFKDIKSSALLLFIMGKKYFKRAVVLFVTRWIAINHRKVSI
jgi:uncharacterized membrane protein